MTSCESDHIIHDGLTREGWAHRHDQAIALLFPQKALSKSGQSCQRQSVPHAPFVFPSGRRGDTGYMVGW